MEIAGSYSKRWLQLGVAALAVAGLFALALVVARTPQLGAFKEFFGVALVVHVDLSVLMWFLCMGGMGWSALIVRGGNRWPYWQAAAFYLTAAATVLMALSPFFKPWHVVKSNYIPVLDHPLFLTSLTLLACGMAVMLVQLLITFRRAATRRALSWVELGWLYAGFTALLALMALFISGSLLAEPRDRDSMFEQLFWAGGHGLQFTYCALMMAAWLLLFARITEKPLTHLGIFLAFAALAAGSIYHIAAFAMYPRDLLAINAHASRVMIEILGIAPTALALMIFLPLLRFLITARHVWNAYTTSLIASLVLFGFGGMLGLMISGQNVTIPAHYHGSIVGVTLALMGAAYALLPALGYADVSRTRLARWQPVVYAVGQIMHIGALAYSGGYGVLRKSPDAAEALALNVKIALGIMGMGGLLAIVGGLMFVVVMARAFWRTRRALP